MGAIEAPARTSKRPPVVDGDVAYVELTKGQTTVIDADDAVEVGRFSWYAVRHRDSYYAETRFPGKGTVGLHRFLLGFPENLVDHKNGNTLDNRRKNLREVTNPQNQQNRQGARRDSSTGIRGVSIISRPYGDTIYQYYRGRVRHDGREYKTNFPFTPEGLAQAEHWVLAKRLELFTHSDGR
jgi:hypothetical protein